MTRFVAFGVGSPVVVDVEESAHRAGIELVLAVANRPTPRMVTDAVPLVAPENLSADVLLLPILVALFTPGHRQQAVQEAEGLGFRSHFTLIDPTAALPRAMTLGVGNYVNVGCSFGGASTFGDFAFVNRGVSIGHHAHVGRYVSFGPGATVAGGVTIGSGTMIGAGSTVLPSITIGANAVVAAGSVVTRDVPDECLVMGNPARVVRRGIGGHKGLRVT